MEFNLKFIVLFTFLFCTTLTDTFDPQLTLNCDFQSYTRNTCKVKDLENHDQNSVFSKVIGNHAANKSNELVTGLIIKQQNITYVPRKISKFFPNLQRYDVRISALISIQREDFEGFNHLESIILVQNNLEALSYDVFHDLSQLKSLRLSENKLKTLHYKIFWNNINLEELALDNNQLSFIHEELLTELRKLTSIYLQNNRIEDLREQTFANNRQLELIELTNNRLKTIGPELITGLENLKTFNFTNNDCITRSYKTTADLSELFKTFCFPPYFRRFELEIQSLHSIRKKLNESLLSCEIQLSEEKTSLTRLQDELETANKEDTTLNEERNECVTKIGLIKTNLDKCESEKDIKETELLEFIGNLTECESSEKNFVKTLELTNKTVATTMKDITECKLKTDILVTNSELMKLRIENLEKKLQNEVNVTTGDKELQSSQVDQIRIKLKALDDGIVNLRQKNNDLIGSNHALKQQTEKLEENLKDFEELNFKLAQENKNIKEKLEQADKNVTRITLDLKECMTDMPACSSFLLDCTFHVVNKPDEYVCLAKHVSACQPGMKLILGGTHSSGKSYVDVKVLEIHDSIFHFTDDIFKHLPRLSKIHVRNGGLSALKPKLKSSSLKELEIEINSFRDVPNEVFSEVRNLNSLLLENNGIEILFKDSFVGLNELKELSLKDNRISEFPQGVFDHLTSLTHLSMKNNRLTSLSGNLLKSNSVLEVVKFDHNKDLKLIGLTLLNFSKSLRMFHFDGTCVGLNYDGIREIKERIRFNCQK